MHIKMETSKLTLDALVTLIRTINDCSSVLRLLHNKHFKYLDLI